MMREFKEYTLRRTKCKGIMLKYKKRKRYKWKASKKYDRLG